MRVLGAILLMVAAVALAHATPPAGYVIPGNGAGYDPHARQLAAILEELKGIREELRQQRAGAPAKPGADRKAARDQYLLRACAKCHTPTRADGGKDGGFPLFDDDEGRALRRLSPREQAEVADRVKRGDMPPGKPAAPKERELFD